MKKFSAMTFKNLLTIVVGGMLILMLGIGLGMHLYAKSLERETEQMARCQEPSGLCDNDDPACKDAASQMTDKALPALLRCLPGADKLMPH
ncbi:MAG: hypothetical protein KBB38_09180 [Bacteroidia bacterium]|nr:hypothetical protein [Bacteroidia bacterium]HRI40992.1 hypothetical protein [Bacteroidia bacterium]